MATWPFFCFFFPFFCAVVGAVVGAVGAAVGAAAVGGAGAAAVDGAGGGAAFGTRLCGVAPHKMHGEPSFGKSFPTDESTNPALAQQLVRSANQSSVTFC